MTRDQLALMVEEVLEEVLEERKKKRKKKKKSSGKKDACYHKVKSRYSVWPCVPLHSEALTKRGWKKHDEIEKGELILSYDRFSDTLKWTPVKRVHFYENADVVAFKKQHHNLECTPNHKWVVVHCTQRNNYQDRDYSLLEEAKRTFQAIQDYKKGKITLEEGTRLTGSSLKHHYNKYAELNFEEFLASSKKYARATSRMVEAKDINRYNSSLLTAARLDPSYPPVELGSVGKYSDNWVEKILNMSYEQVSSFFASAIIYDGNQQRDMQLVERKNRSFNSFGFKQKDKQHGDIFELAAFLSGYNVCRGKINETTGITPFTVRENRFCNLQVCTLEEREEQDVWCPETEYGTWVMRQNGRILITGNSAYASGALVKCRKVGAKNWGKSTNEELALDEEELQEILAEEDEETLEEKKRKKRKLTKKPSSETNLGDWFKRKGAKGSSGGWVDCNAPDGKGGYKTCGRKKGEKRSKYPACRPTPSACKTKGKGKKWGKKGSKRKNESVNSLQQLIENEILSLLKEQDFRDSPIVSSEDSTNLSEESARENFKQLIYGAPDFYEVEEVWLKKTLSNMEKDDLDKVLDSITDEKQKKDFFDKILYYLPPLCKDKLQIIDRAVEKLYEFEKSRGNKVLNLSETMVPRIPKSFARRRDPLGVSIIGSDYTYMEIPDFLSIKGDLIIKDSDIPLGLDVRGTLDLGRVLGIFDIPDDTKFYTLETKSGTFDNRTELVAARVGEKSTGVFFDIVVDMPSKTFLFLTTKGPEKNKYGVDLSWVQQDKLDKIKTPLRFNHRDSLPYLAINSNYKVNDHEGRHRSLKNLIENGPESTIPVKLTFEDTYNAPVLVGKKFGIESQGHSGRYDVDASLENVREDL